MAFDEEYDERTAARVATPVSAIRRFPPHPGCIAAIAVLAERPRKKRSHPDATVKSMDVSRIAEVVASVAPEAEDHFSLEYLNPDSTEYRKTRATAVNDFPGLQTLIAVLEEELPWSADDKITIRTAPTSGSGLDLFHVARYLVAQARVRDSEEAVRELLEFIETNRLSLLEVMPLWGLNPSTEIGVHGDVRLISLAQVPDSLPRDLLLGVERSRYPVRNTFALVPRPRAALIRAFDFGPVFDPAGTGDVTSPGSHARAAAAQDASELMRGIARCLVPLLARPIFPIAHWFQCDENTPLINTVGGWGGCEIDRRFIEEVSPHDVDTASTTDYVHQYLSLNSETRMALRVPIERLNRAMLRRTLEDTALDLGVALEALLCPQKAPEIGYRLQVRGTLLLGGTAEERRRTRRLLKDLYDQRSTAAHEGTIAKKRDHAAALLDRGLELCSALIRDVVWRGRIPDWDALTMGW